MLATPTRFFPLCNGEPYHTIVAALAGLNLVELKLTMWAQFVEPTTKELWAFYRTGFPSLRTLRLYFRGFPPNTPSRADAAKMVHAFLCACPALDTLFLMTEDRDETGLLPLPTHTLFELSTTGENQLNSGPPALTTLTLKDTKYCLTPGLASCFNIQSLRELHLEAREDSLLTTITEGFWATLANMDPNSVQLERLRCPRLSPRLIEFLSSFSGLRWLKFNTYFCPFSPSKTPGLYFNTRQQTAALEVHDLSADELDLLDAFFHKVIPKHSTSLEYLVFGNW